jgi:DNA helicase HerA-like ATPase
VVFGKRESGKTNAATVLAEELLTAHAQVVICDPVGSWYGLRASSDGRGPGFPIPIIGGEHADVVLDPASGALVADLVVNERVSLLLDVSELDPPEMIWVLTDFFERLYRKNRRPLHLICEEADEIAPERQRHMARYRGIPEGYTQDRLLWAVSRIVRKGAGTSRPGVHHHHAALLRDLEGRHQPARHAHRVSDDVADRHRRD